MHLEQPPQKSHEQDRYACHELYCVFGDFYASRTHDAEITKSLYGLHEFELFLCFVLFPYVIKHDATSKPRLICFHENVGRMNSVVIHPLHCTFTYK